MKIFDCFTFYCELELLDLRLMELYEVVDHFVIVEATRTHQGRPHDPVFLAHREHFAPYLDKIVHVLVEDLPLYQHEDRQVRDRNKQLKPFVDWRPEHFSRNAIERGLEGRAKVGDRILISDSDEIPTHEAVCAEAPRPEDVAWTQDLYYYYVNTIWSNARWHGTLMTTYGQQQSWQYARDTKRNIKRKIIDGAHFSYTGEPDIMADRIDNFSHAHEWADRHSALLTARQTLQHPLGAGPLTVTTPPAYVGMPAFLAAYPQFLSPAVS